MVDDYKINNYKEEIDIWKNTVQRKQEVFGTSIVRTTIPNESYLDDSLGYMNIKWTTPALLQYYIDPRWIGSQSSPIYSQYDGYNNGVLHKRIDSRAGSIAHSASTGMMGVVLPNGLESIRINFNKLKNLISGFNLTQTIRESISDLERVCNDEFYELINNPALNIYPKLSSLVFDYLNYGTAISILEKVKKSYTFTYVPFMQSALISPENSYIQEGLWALPDYSVRADNVLKFHKKLYVHGSSLESSEYSDNSYYLIEEYGANNDIISPQSTRKIFGYRDKSPMLIARLNPQGQVYGIGSGLKSLGNIIQLNYYTNCTKFASMGAFFPAMVFSDDVKVETNNNPHGNAFSQDYTESLSAMPGSRITVSRNPGVMATGSKPFDILSSPIGQMNVFENQMKLCIEDIQSSYYLTFIGLLHGNYDITATEVRERASQASQQFKGVTEPFYSHIIFPMASAFAEIALSNIASMPIAQPWIENLKMVIPSLNIQESMSIEIINHEKKSTQAERLSNISAYLQILRQIYDLAQISADKDLEYLKKEAENILI